MMFLERLYGVTVSVGFGDYLNVALAHNRPMLDRCVVVTLPSDKETQKIAGKHNCDLVVTVDGEGCKPPPPGATPTQLGVFNKGALIERGLQQLPGDGWRVFFDADIVFPGNLRQHLEGALYDREALYGVDRINVVGWEEWQNLLATGWATKGFEYHHFLNYPPIGLKIGARLVYGEHGWVPIGYFQLWHASVETVDIYRVRTYPLSSPSAAHDDVKFGLRWDRHKRVLIPEVFVAHLQTGESSRGKNWNGRVTPRFGPKPKDALGQEVEGESYVA